MAAGRHIDGFELLAEDYHSDAYVAWRAQREGACEEVRLTLFYEEVSESSRFRAAFRKDQPSLGSMHHPHLLSPIAWGEDGGRLYYVTEHPPGDSLADRLADDRSITWDEFIDLCWQIASALQHAHNVGLTHGHLTTSLIDVTDEIRCKVMGFGLYRWIAAATPGDVAERSFAEQAIHDLTELGHILEAVFHSLTPEAMRDVDQDQVTSMTDLINDLQNPAPDLLARDVQGRLGNMLLQESGESIKMVDHREGQHLSRRSIVDELFDDPRSVQSIRPVVPGTKTSASSGPLVRMIIIVGAVVLLAGLALAAFHHFT